MFVYIDHHISPFEGGQGGMFLLTVLRKNIKHGSSFVLYFSVFLLRYRVIHYTRTGLYKYPLLAAVRVCRLKESTAYHYCQLHIAVEVQKAYPPAIYVASVGF